MYSRKQVRNSTEAIQFTSFLLSDWMAQREGRPSHRPMGLLTHRPTTARPDLGPQTKSPLRQSATRLIYGSSTLKSCESTRDRE